MWVVGKEDFILGRAGLISISHSNILPKSDLFRLFFFFGKSEYYYCKVCTKKDHRGRNRKERRRRVLTSLT